MAANAATSPPQLVLAGSSNGHVDKGFFEVFTLNDASRDHTLKFIFRELLTSCDAIKHFKIPISALVSIMEPLEVGYSQHRNPYHNLMHDTDVTRTIHYFLFKTVPSLTTVQKQPE